MNYPPTVPLVLIAMELGANADELAERFGDAVLVDDVTGLRSLPAERCREVITAHFAAVQAAREQHAARQAELAARPNPLRERVKALAAEQAAHPGDPDTPALVRALAADPESAWNVRAAALDEQRSGQTVMHIIKRQADR